MNTWLLPYLCVCLCVCVNLWKISIWCHQCDSYIIFIFYLACNIYRYCPLLPPSQTFRGWKCLFVLITPINNCRRWSEIVTTSHCISTAPTLNRCYKFQTFEVTAKKRTKSLLLNSFPRQTQQQQEEIPFSQVSGSTGNKQVQYWKTFCLYQHKSEVKLISMDVSLLSSCANIWKNMWL